MTHWNWRPDPAQLCYMDVETVSAENLKAVGARTYLRHYTTRLLSAAFLWRGVVYVWLPNSTPDGVRAPECGRPVVLVHGGIPHEIADAVRDGCTFVAHNAEAFDSQAWERFAPADLQPTWLDTMHLSRAAGLPGGLNDACEALGLPGKDKGGKDSLNLLSKATVARDGVRYPLGTPSAWNRLLEYNVRDVSIMESLYQHVAPYAEPDVLDVHCRINRRGIKVDLKFAAVLRKLWEVAQTEAADALDGVTEGEVSSPRSIAAFREWLKTLGKPVGTLRRQDIDAMLAGDYFGDTATDPVAQRIEAAILARQLAARATPGKVDRVFSSVDPDWRCRDLTVYHGAHTGRFSSRRLQIHNMPRGVKMDLDGLLALYHAQGYFNLDDVRNAAPKANIGDALATLMRPVIVAEDGCSLVIVDYAQVEARGAAWLAGDAAALAAFASDPYCAFATKLFGRTITKADEKERQVGKICMLGLQYGMAGVKLERTAELLGSPLSAVGLTGAACVQVYRETFNGIASMWREINLAAQAVICDEESITHAHRCTFRRAGADMHLTLPSGRRLVYRGVGWNYGEFGREMHYRSTHGYAAKLYGGKLVENIVQGFCRDFLTASMVDLDPQFSVIFHAHDEAVFEIPDADVADAIDVIGRRMSTPPQWASGFPLACEGFASKRYTKSKPAGAIYGEWSLGRRVK